jgi:hypothetical protein
LSTTYRDEKISVLSSFFFIGTLFLGINSVQSSDETIHQEGSGGCQNQEED